MVLVLIYNEDVDVVFGWVVWMWYVIEKVGEVVSFVFFVLSDLGEEVGEIECVVWELFVL